MPILAARFANRTGSRGVGRDFGESYRSLAAERAQTAANAGWVSEAAIEQRKALDTAAVQRNQSRDRIDAGDGENFPRRCQPCPSNLVGKPIARDLIDLRTGPVISLFFIRMNSLRNAARKIRALGFLLCQ